MLHRFSGGLWFEDCRGNLQCFRGVPESKQADLESALRFFRWAIADATARQPSASFADLWRNTPTISQSGSVSLQLCNLSLEWLSIDQIAEFLIGVDGQRSLIEQVCFPITRQVVDAAINQTTYERRQATLVSALITVGLATDFDSAWSILERCTGSEVEELIQARVEAIDPKAGVKRQLQELGQEIAAKAQETGKDPTLPSGWSLEDLPLE